jgi:hypothetical protein
MKTQPKTKLKDHSLPPAEKASVVPKGEYQARWEGWRAQIAARRAEITNASKTKTP